MRLILGIVVMLAGAGWPEPVDHGTQTQVAAVVTGFARAVDGDDLAFGRVRIRLWGIAAPGDGRYREPGGPEATAALAAMIRNQRVVCALTGDTAGRSLRPVARCRARGVDLGTAMVRAGGARDCPAHSLRAHANAEAEARARARDLSARYPLPDYCLPDP